MIIKAVNNSIGFNALILNLLVFKTYLRIINKNVLLLLIIKRIKIIRVITKEV